MIIPEKVKVLYKEYSVIEEENLHDEKSDLYGQIRYIEEVIALNTASSDEQKKATLVHELIHGIDEMYRIGLEEEQIEQIEKLGNAVYMLIKDNKEMFKE